MRHVSYQDHKKEDGSIDWPTYKAAEKIAREADTNEGVYCYTCGTYLIFSRGYRDQCHSCRAMENDAGEITHDDFIRCPACGKRENVHDMDRGHLYEEGEHSVCCESCEHDYEFSTRVSYSFSSPARVGVEADVDA